MAEKYIFRGKIVSGARKLTMFANCSNPTSSILIVEGSVYTRNILSFIPAEDIDQIKLAFTYRGVKHTGPHPRINNTKMYNIVFLPVVIIPRDVCRCI